MTLGSITINECTLTTQFRPLCIAQTSTLFSNNLPDYHTFKLFSGILFTLPTIILVRVLTHILGKYFYNLYWIQNKLSNWQTSQVHSGVKSVRWNVYANKSLHTKAKEKPILVRPQYRQCIPLNDFGQAARPQWIEKTSSLLDMTCQWHWWIYTVWNLPKFAQPSMFTTTKETMWKPYGHSFHQIKLGLS